MRYRVQTNGVYFRAQAKRWIFWVSLSRWCDRVTAEKIIDSHIEDRKPWRTLWEAHESKIEGRVGDHEFRQT